MRATNFLILIMIMFLTVSCEDILNQEPKSAITKVNFWQTPRDAEAGLLAVYNLYMNTVYRQMELGDFRSDNIEIPPKWGFEMVNPPTLDFNANNISPTDGISSWNMFFNVIARANEVYYFTGLIDFVDAADKNRILGEALFLRANMYFVLAKNWGAVPLITEPFLSEGDNMYVERTPVNEIYAQIIEDINLAEQLLPENRSNLRIRATKAAAQAQLVDVLLTRGYTSFAQSTDFETAVIKADAVIANPNYSLESGANYANIFRNDGNRETILEIDFDFNNNATQGFSNAFLPRAFQKFRPFGGQTHALPSHSLVESFDSLDLRRETTFKFLGPPEAQYFDNHLVGMPYVNKFLGTITEMGVQRYSDDNIIIYRLADVLLMKAEALVRTNDVPGAMLIVNQIRTRAGLVDVSASTPEQAIDLILAERKKELAFEGKRWYDLVRNDKVSEFRTEPEFMQGRILLAVPQPEIDRNPKLLPQNPTYN